MRGADDLLLDLGGIAGGPQPAPEEVEVLESLEEGAADAADISRALGISTDEARERLARLELLGFAGPGEPSG